MTKAGKRTKVLRKKKWIDMEITKVPLNPEQAVLTCCEHVTRALEGGGVVQCDSGSGYGGPCGSPPSVYSVSS